MSNLIVGQIDNDWPSKSAYHAYENPNQKEGTESYESGHLCAFGPLEKSGTEKVVKVNGTEVTETIYKRAGTWTVYYDSSVRITRSIGQFINGKKNGDWKVFGKNGDLRSEYTFYNDLIKKQINVDKDGSRTAVINRSDGTMFYLDNVLLLFFLGLVPIVGIRPFWNLVVWNNIYKTKYIPGFSMFKKGELNANVYCAMIFWWLRDEKDSKKIKRLKRIGNSISAISVLIAGLFIIFLTMYSV